MTEPPSPLGSERLINAYYLQEDAARAVRAGGTTCPQLEEVYDKAVAMGVPLVRTLAFNDDPGKAGDTAIQLGPSRYDEVSLRGLDLVLTRAAAHGLRLILPLGNHWDAYGGARQYVAWAGLADPVEGDPRFYTDAAVRALYLAHLAHLLERTNSLDGIRYGDHPAVFAWELLNEPRGTGLDPGGEQLRAWVDEVAATVKRHSPDKLVSVGEEGFEGGLTPDAAVDWPDLAAALSLPGSSFALNTASPGVDLASLHFYPEAWGLGGEQLPEAGARWLTYHAQIAAALGKPILVGEFALLGEGGLPLADRRALYRGWLRCASRLNARAAGPWMFADDARPSQWDPSTFKFLDGTAAWDPRNQYADLLGPEPADPDLP